MQKYQLDEDDGSQCQIGPLFFPLHYFHSFRDDLGDKTSKKNILQINLLSFWAKIEPKLSKLQKTIKIEKKNHQKSLFSYRHLVIFFIFLKIKHKINIIDSRLLFREIFICSSFHSYQNCKLLHHILMKTWKE